MSKRKKKSVNEEFALLAYSRGTVRFQLPASIDVGVSDRHWSTEDERQTVRFTFDTSQREEFASYLERVAAIARVAHQDAVPCS